MAQTVKFNIRKTLGIQGLCLYSKKKEGWVTRKEVADAICEKLNRKDIWAADIEDLVDVENEDKIKALFEEVQNDRKFYS